MTRIRDKVDVVLLGQNNLVREGLKRIINSDSFNVSISEESSTFLLNREAHGEPVELFVIDAGDSDNPINFDLEGIHRSYPCAKIVILHDSFNFDYMVNAFQSGADGYIIKNIECEPLLESLRLVAMGEKVMPSALANVLPECGKKLQEADAGTRLDEIFSEREIETLRCVCRGDPNKVIAQRLNISEATVKVHVKAILRKLRLRNRTQAAAWSLKAGIDFSQPRWVGRPEPFGAARRLEPAEVAVPC